MRERDERGRAQATAQLMVRVLDEDAELAAALGADERQAATAAALAPVRAMRFGTSGPALVERMRPTDLGLLVLEGLLVRRVHFGQVHAVELLGSGDLVCPWTADAGGRTPRVHWELLSHVRIAVLDAEFVTRTQAWPGLSGALIGRVGERTQTALLHAAVRQVVGVEDRLLLVLWDLAQRWGEDTPGGRAVQLRAVSGATLAGLVGARRQSVSTAIGRLTERGALARRSDGTWFITAEPSLLADYLAAAT